MNKKQSKLLIVALIIFAFARVAPAQTTTFTYQGRLTDSSTTANGTYDLRFALFDAASGGTQIGTTQTRAAVTVSNGIFTVQLDFGAAAFPGANRFLEIAVKRPEVSTYTTLAPRQEVTNTPYAIRAVSAETADTANNATQFNGLGVEQFVQTDDARLSDERTPAPGSANYVQNTTAQQAATNFNISGNGTLGGTLSANTVNSQTQFNIGGQRVLFFNDDNLFAGLAGASNTTGNSNSFAGSRAGNANTTGSRNSFFGNNAGFINTTGGDNAFFGLNAGNLNSTGGNNTIVGSSANTNSANLTFAAAFGSFARVAASDTIVLGKTAGTYNGAARPADTVQIPGSLSVSGTLNASGVSLTNLNASNITTGTLDTARIPSFDTSKITTGTFDTARIPNLDAAKITSGTFDATRIPNLDASKITSGTFDAMRIPDLGATYIRNQTTQQTGNFNVSGNGAAGGTLTAGGTISGALVNSNSQFNLSGSRFLFGDNNRNNISLGFGALPNAASTNNLMLNNIAIGNSSGASNTDGVKNIFLGSFAGQNNSTGSSNSFVGAFAGRNTTGSSNVFFGTEAGLANTTGANNVFIGVSAADQNTTGSNNTIIGANAAIGTQSPGLNYATAIGAGSNVVTSNTIGLGRINGSDTVIIYGGLNVNGLGTGGIQQLCVNAQQLVSTCSSSLRYKTNVAPFFFGLNLVRQLRPISFDWKDGGMKDVGFVAEDVAKLNPQLVIYNKAGQVEGVKYDRLSVLFVNAFKEQQTQIERQQRQIAELKSIVCQIKSDAEICKTEDK